MPGYSHGPITMPVIQGPTTPGGHLLDSFHFTPTNIDSHGVPGSHIELPVTHPHNAHGGQLLQERLDHFLANHPELAGHVDLTGGFHLSHNQPFVGHVDWAV